MSLSTICGERFLRRSDALRDVNIDFEVECVHKWRFAIVERFGYIFSRIFHHLCGDKFLSISDSLWYLVHSFGVSVGVDGNRMLKALDDMDDLVDFDELFSFFSK